MMKLQTSEALVTMRCGEASEDMSEWFWESPFSNYQISFMQELNILRRSHLIMVLPEMKLLSQLFEIFNCSIFHRLYEVNK